MKSQKTKHKIPNTKNNKGITLVALVITIIVLIILAVVAIGALQNHGIINYAKNARTEYAEGEVKENAVLGNYLSKLEENALGNGGEGNGDGEGSGTENEGENGNQGEGAGSGNDTQVEILKPMGTGPWTKNAEGKLVSSDGVIAEIGVTTYTTAQVLEKLGVTVQREKYSGDWIVLGLDGTNLKLLSLRNVGRATLGYRDPTVNMDEIEEIYNSDNLDFERAMWSYNHAVETLNNVAKEQTGITSARSITVEDLESEDVFNITEESKEANCDYYERKTYKYYLENGKIYSQNIKIDNPDVDDLEESWSQSAVSSVDVFINWDKTIIDNTDENRENIVKIYTRPISSWPWGCITEEQSIKFKKLNDTGSSYLRESFWFATQFVGANKDYVSFELFWCTGMGGEPIWMFRSDGKCDKEMHPVDVYGPVYTTWGVRAVILV